MYLFLRSRTFCEPLAQHHGHAVVAAAIVAVATPVAAVAAVA